MNIRDSIVAVLNERGKIVGTGFLVSEKLVLTCAHVVVLAGAIDGDTVQVRFDGRAEKIDALVVPEYWRDVDKGDVALLRLENVPEGITPLPLGNAAGSPGHDFYAYGYAIVTDVQGIGARGKIVDIVNNGRLVQLTSQEPDHGMSGGPVLDEQRRVVIGMVTKGKGLLEKDQNLRNTQTTFATSVEIIREACLELRLTEICPYRSLDVFNEEDALFFFGREKVVQKLIDSLKREPRFLAVLGPSGSGKSSVVRAGLIPALRQGKVPGSQKWGIVTIRPANDPFEQLTGAGFINPQAGMESSVKTWLADRLDKTRLVLFIDQFEEVLVSTPKDVRQKFIAELARLLDAPLTITVVLSLRDDFYGRFLQDAAVLAGWLERGLINVPPVLEQDDLRAMVVEPAKSVGLSFDEGLVDIIISDTCEADRSKSLAHSTILPLLEFALTQLWELRKDGRLTHKAYKIIGGTTGSLSQWADKVYYELSPHKRKLTEQILCGLVHFGNDKEQIPDTRRVIPIGELAKGNEKESIEQIVGEFIQARLLSAHREYKSGQRLVEIIHDALLREWKLLAQWINDFRNREQKARARHRLLITLGLATGSIVALILFCVATISLFIAFEQRNSAINAQNTAIVEANLRATAQAESTQQVGISQAGELASQSNNQHDKSFELSLLLSVEAFRVADTAQTRSELLTNVQTFPQLLRILWSDNVKISPLLNSASKPQCIAFSPDNKVLASGNSDGVIILYSVDTYTPIGRVVPGDSCPIAFSPDGKTIASGNKDQNISLWDITTFQLIGQLVSENKESVSSLIFSPDGRTILSGSSGIAPSPTHAFILWDVETRHPVSAPVIGQFNFSPYSIAFTPNGETLIAASVKGGISLLDFSHQEQPFFPLSSEVLSGNNFLNSLSLSPDGKTLALGTNNGSIFLWSMITHELVGKPLIGHAHGVQTLSFSPDGKILASGSVDNAIMLWSVATQELINDSLQGPTMSEVSGTSINHIAFSPDGKMLASCSSNGDIVFWNLNPNLSIGKILGTQGKLVLSVAFSPNGKILATGSNDHTIILWDIATRQAIGQPLVGHSDSVFTVAFSPDGKILASGSCGKVDNQGICNQEEIILWDVVAHRPIGQSLTKNTGFVNSIAFSPDGKTIASGSAGGTVTIWDLVSNQPIGPSPSGMLPIISVAFDPNGETLAAGTHDADIFVWNLENGLPVGTPLHHLAGTGNVIVAFSPDGKILASEDFGARILFLDSVTLNEVGKTLTGHSNNIFSIAFSPDGRMLASGSYDKTIILWDVATRQALGQPLTGHTDGVNSIAFSPDGKILASGGSDNTIFLWPADPLSWAELNCQRVGRNFTQSEWLQYFPDEPYLLTCPQYPAGQ